MFILLAISPQHAFATEPSVSFAKEVVNSAPVLATEKSKFKLSIFNGTKKSIKVLTENCSAGYEMISFELISPAGRSYQIARKPKNWQSKVQKSTEVHSGRQIFRKINFGDGTWAGFPSRIPGSGGGWKLQAKLTVEDSKLFQIQRIWVGKIESGFVPATRKD
jgi:hypothetical protein